jgi:hypothetical protein
MDEDLVHLAVQGWGRTLRALLRARHVLEDLRATIHFVRYDRISSTPVPMFRTRSPMIMFATGPHRRDIRKGHCHTLHHVHASGLRAFSFIDSPVPEPVPVPVVPVWLVWLVWLVWVPVPMPVPVPVVVS